MEVDDDSDESDDDDFQASDSDDDELEIRSDASVRMQTAAAQFATASMREAIMRPEEIGRVCIADALYYYPSALPQAADACKATRIGRIHDALRTHTCPQTLGRGCTQAHAWDTHAPMLQRAAALYSPTACARCPLPQPLLFRFRP
jgi:hypothetical protein